MMAAPQTARTAHARRSGCCRALVSGMTRHYSRAARRVAHYATAWRIFIVPRRVVAGRIAADEACPSLVVRLCLARALPGRRGGGDADTARADHRGGHQSEEARRRVHLHGRTHMAQGEALLLRH